MRRFSCAIALVAICAASNPAAAAQCTFPDAEKAGCVCTLAVDPNSTAPVANLTDIVGDVAVTRQAGYTPLPQPITEPVSLFAGDSIVIPDDGQAYLNFGPDCHRLLPANSSVVIRQENGCACAAAFGLEETGGNAKAVVAGVTVIVGTAAILASQNEHKKKPSSP